MENPSEVEFNGQCAFAVSLGKEDVAGRPDVYKVKNGKKYLFSNPVAKFLWSVIPGQSSKRGKFG